MVHHIRLSHQTYHHTAIRTIRLICRVSSLSFELDKRLTPTPTMLDSARPFPGSIKARPSTILRPGIPVLPPGTERYRVPGQGSVVVPVEAGDEIQLRDAEGKQACEIAFAGMDGRFDATAFGGKDSRPSEGLLALLKDDGESAERSRTALKRRGL